jgi:hypothetical protein
MSGLTARDRTAVLSANAARPPHLSLAVIVPILIAIVAVWAAGWYRVLPAAGAVNGLTPVAPPAFPSRVSTDPIRHRSRA